MMKSNFVRREYMLLILIIIFITFTFASCAPSGKTGDKFSKNIFDGKTQDKKETESNDDPNKPPIVITVQQGIEEPQYQPEVASLLKKSEGLNSYQYDFDVFQPGIYYKVFVHNGKIRKVYSDTLKLKGDVNYNEIYLDQEKKEALAICTKPGVSCSSVWKKAYTVDYIKESAIIVPFYLLNNLSYDAHKVGEEIIDNRNTIIIEYTGKQGARERLWLDYYYGVPFKYVVYDTTDKEMTKHTFTRFIVDLKEQDVLLPEGYKLIE